MTDPVHRFSNRVENYVKYRPGYPAQLLALLVSRCGFTAQSVVADIGCGTGNLARLFLENGNPVFGIEPNHNMRAAAKLLLQDFPAFTSVAATAEATTLPAACADFVTAGQAFHWFHPQSAHREFLRLLRPGGWIVLVWNQRDTAAPFYQQYEQLLREYAIDYPRVDHKRLTDSQLAALLGADMQKATFEYRQAFDLAGLQGRLLSSSYAPLAGHPNHAPMLGELSRIFAQHQRGGSIEFTYNTHIYFVQAG